MLGIVVTFLIAVVGLFLLLALVLREDGAARHRAKEQGHSPLAGLTAVCVPFRVLDGKDDYRKLAGRAELQPLRKVFRRDRRRIVLMWLRELRKDVHVLWKFRRFLASNGLSVTFREEAAVLFATLFALVYLHIACAAVLIIGPFALQRAFEGAGALIEWLAHFVVARLERAPAPRKAEIERGWMQQHFATGIKAG